MKLFMGDTVSQENMQILKKISTTMISLLNIYICPHINGVFIHDVSKVHLLINAFRIKKSTYIYLIFHTTAAKEKI